MPSSVIGSTNTGASIACLVIGSTGDHGMSSLCHDPKTLTGMFNNFNNISPPSNFASGVALRTNIMNQVAKVYDCPFSAAVTTTVPVGMDFIEATVRGGNGSTSYEFNVMRTVDFIGRNYLMINLPRIDCSTMTDNVAAAGDPRKYFLGAWHRDLVPRIISRLSFYSRGNNHILFEYSGYDIYIFNVLFGNAQKEMNDVMAGEDKFELAYDPYYVNGAALGLSSFKAINPFVGIIGGSTGSPMQVIENLEYNNTMDPAEFREFYRRGVWFEPPTYINNMQRHSIHARRMVHSAKTLWIPLDILPFGYSIASAIPVGAIHGDSGYIHLEINPDWLSNSFYLTALSDIPSICPMPNHVHYEAGDVDIGGDPIGGSDPRIGWVNDLSLGRMADGFSRKRPSAVEDGNVIINNLGSIIPSPVGATEAAANLVSTTYVAPTGSEGIYANAHDAPFTNGPVTFHNLQKTQKKANIDAEFANPERFIYKIQEVSPLYHEQLKNQLEVRLIQVGYKTLACVRDLINKLPCVYIATEWSDIRVPILRNHIEILNDLYLQGIVLWFLPEDPGYIESIRMYAKHYIDHELPVINRVQMTNENGQGTSIFTWQMLNTVMPNILGAGNALPENMGVIAFSPKFCPNDFPYAFYDTNINGQIRLDIIPFDIDSPVQHETSTAGVNMKRGSIMISSFGVNGIALSNLTMFRMVF